jgi:hypothetical protein
VWLNLKYYPDNCLKGLRKATKNVSSDTRYPNRDSNRTTTEFKLEALPMEPACPGVSIQSHVTTMKILPYVRSASVSRLPSGESSKEKKSNKYAGKCMESNGASNSAMQISEAEDEKARKSSPPPPRFTRSCARTVKL